jgi:hypothetical protein
VFPLGFAFLSFPAWTVRSSELLFFLALGIVELPLEIVRLAWRCKRWPHKRCDWTARIDGEREEIVLPVLVHFAMRPGQEEEKRFRGHQIMDWTKEILCVLWFARRDGVPFNNTNDFSDLCLSLSPNKTVCLTECLSVSSLEIFYVYDVWCLERNPYFDQCTDQFFWS